MADYIGITDEELAPGQPVTTSLMFRMRDDAMGIMQNDPDTPAANRGNFVPRKIFYTAPTTFLGNIPEGVNRIFVTLVGGGAGGSGVNASSETSGTDGADTSITVGGVTYTAEGGLATGIGGQTVNIPYATGLTINGQNGAHNRVGHGGSNQFGQGGRGAHGELYDGSAVQLDGLDAAGWGAGGGGGYYSGSGGSLEWGRGGGAGGVAQFWLAVTPGEAYSVTVGTSGAGGVSLADGGDGTSGFVMIDY